MKRASWILIVCVLGACLEPGAPMLARLDDSPPRLLRIIPGEVDDGGIPELPTSGRIELVFSEQLDLRTLHPAIALFRGEEPVEVVIKVPEVEPPIYTDPDVEFTVVVEPAAPLLLGATYTLVIRTLLLDAQGNAFPEERQFRYRIIL